MAEIEKLLKNIVMGSVGAVTTVVEKTGDLARTLVEKGETTIAENRETVDGIKKSLHDMADEVVRIGKEAARLTREQRDALRSLLDEIDRAEDEAKAAADEEAKAADEAEAEAADETESEAADEAGDAPAAEAAEEDDVNGDGSNG